MNQKNLIQLNDHTVKHFAAISYNNFKLAEIT